MSMYGWVGGFYERDHISVGSYWFSFSALQGHKEKYLGRWCGLISVKKVEVS